MALYIININKNIILLSLNGFMYSKQKRKKYFRNEMDHFLVLLPETISNFSNMNGLIILKGRDGTDSILNI